MNSQLFVACCLAVAVLATASVSSRDVKRTYYNTYVYDGDTIFAVNETIFNKYNWVRSQGKKPWYKKEETFKIRLFCIDTPEMKQKPWGYQSRNALRKLLPFEEKFYTINDSTDKYGRVLAYIHRSSDDLNVNEEMVRDGWAVAFKYQRGCSSKYNMLQQEAQEDEENIWEPGNGFVLPEDFKHGK